MVTLDLLLVAIAALPGVFLVVPAASFKPWTILKPEVFLNDLSATCSRINGEKLVIGDRGPVGRWGGLWTGSHWTAEQLYPEERYMVVAWGNHIFVRVGSIWLSDGTESGAIWHSRDGIQWTEALGLPATASQAIRVVYGEGLFEEAWEVESDERQSIALFSTDGIHWSRSKIERLRTARPSSLLLHNGRFRYCSGLGAIFESRDGYEWSRLSPELQLVSTTGMGINGETTVIVEAFGEILRSSNNGQDWTTIAKPGNVGLSEIAVADGLFVAVGNQGTVLTSVDGLEWKHQKTGVSLALKRIQRFAGEWWVFGANGSIFISVDAQSWKVISSPSPELVSVAGSEKGYVALGPDVIGYSPDGLNWDFQRATNGSSVAYGNGLFVAASDRLRISGDGIHWTNVDLGEPLVGGEVFSGQSRFLVLSTSNYITYGFISTNGTQWEKRYELGDPAWRDDIVPFGDGFVVPSVFEQGVSYLGTRVFSTLFESSSSKIYQRFSTVAAYENFLLFSSEEGHYGIGEPPDQKFEDLQLPGYPLVQQTMTIGTNLFLVGGGDGETRTGLPPQLWMANLRSWNLPIDTMPLTTRFVRSMATDGRSSVVAVGDGLLMYHSLEVDYLDTPRLRLDRTESGTTMWFHYNPGMDYRLQGSINLTDWEPIKAGVLNGSPTFLFEATGGIARWTIPVDGGLMFYRLAVGQ